MRYVRQAVKEEVSIAVREQGASISDSVLLAMRSGAVTPVQVTPDPHQVQTQILNLLRQGQLNTAFQQVFRDLNLYIILGLHYIHVHCHVEIAKSLIFWGFFFMCNVDVGKSDIFQ